MTKKNVKTLFEACQLVWETKQLDFPITTQQNYFNNLIIDSVPLYKIINNNDITEQEKLTILNEMNNFRLEIKNMLLEKVNNYRNRNNN